MHARHRISSACRRSSTRWAAWSVGRKSRQHLDALKKEQHADVVIADAYKEASVFSFHSARTNLFIYALRNEPPANQYDFWPGYADAHPQRALWITGEPGTSRVAEGLQHDYVSIEHVIVGFRGKPFREYDVYLCSNPKL